MRYYIISGEASGDLHGSNLIRAIRSQDQAADIRAWGGDKMQAAGATLVRHYRDLAFMGFVEVLMHLRTIFNNLSFCRQDITAYKPDVLVLIDYPGFNLRIAEWAKQQGIRVVYYISPQVWAWKENRVKKIKRDVDEMIVILPFEVDFYRKWKFPVTYVGHPLTEVVSADRRDHEVVPVSQKPVIALLPGSRGQEIRAKLPVMLQMTDRFPDYEFVVAQAAAQPDSLYTEIAAGRPIKIVRDQTYNLLRQSVAALVTSGTATLETGLFGVPQVVCYKGNPVSYWLAKKLVKIKYISLVNLIMDKPVVTELIQNDLNPDMLEAELRKILPGGATRQRMETDYAALWHLLGDRKASQGAAEIVVMTANRASKN
jgi:lipid-A-disaccharide synthase